MASVATVVEAGPHHSIIRTPGNGNGKQRLVHTGVRLTGVQFGQVSRSGRPFASIEQGGRLPAVTLVLAPGESWRHGVCYTVEVTQSLSRAPGDDPSNIFEATIVEETPEEMCTGRRPGKARKLVNGGRK